RLRRRRSDRRSAGEDPRGSAGARRRRPGVLMAGLRLGLARIVRAAIRAAGRGGTTAPGRFLLRVEPDAISRLGARLGAGSELVLCADDPLVADLGREREGVTYFGVEDDSLALPELQHAADSKHCRRCGHPYVYEAIFMGHLGHYRCPNCGRERPRPDIAA